MEEDNEANKNVIKSSEDCSDDQDNESLDLTAGIVWERLSTGYRIMDLTKNRFDDALRLAKDQFFAPEPMCKVTNLVKDKPSVRTYLDLITGWINEMHSMCAIHEGTGKLVGIAVASLNRKADNSKGSSRIRMSEGEAIFRIMMLKSCVFEMARLYEKYQINEYFQLHILCVESECQNKGIGTALIRSCIDYYRHLHLPACIGAFSSGASQTIAKRLGFETLAEIPYGEYEMVENNQKPFIDMGVGNYSIACMALRKLVSPTLSRSTSTTMPITPLSEKKKTKKTKGT